MAAALCFHIGTGCNTQKSGHQTRFILTARARFEIASRLSTTDTDTFLKYVGLAPTDRRLAALRNSRGVTVLHLVAEHLRQSPLQSRDWEDLAVCVLKNGANPCSVADAGASTHGLFLGTCSKEDSKESSHSDE